ncbi:MAG: hypothetical protein JJ844_08600 [Prochlorococcus marinus CUG1435]|nr:hypothetical protein [Prochlorococcus marinus CUG1435]
MLRKKYFLITIIIVIIFQILLYTNNNQRTSFRYFKWTIQETSIGKLISISFFSGLFITTLLNCINSSNNKNNNTYENIEENYEPLNNEEYEKSDIEMPPQRDIRETQPTISVNYRVVKNIDDKKFKNNENSSNNSFQNDDWGNNDADW